MAKFSIEEITNKKVWESFVTSHNPSTFLQSWNWGETNKIIGEKIFRLGFFEDGTLVGVCLVIEVSAKRGPHFIIPGGPIMDWENDELIKYFISTLRSLAKKEKVWFVRVRAELTDTKENAKKLKTLGFVPAPMHLHAENTWVLDVTPSEEALLTAMRKTTRYLVKKSLDMELKVEQTTEKKFIDILDTLQKETAARHKFIGFSKKLFTAQIKSFGKDNQAKLFLCKKGGMVLAAAIIIFYNDTAYYHHSGSVSDFREIPFSYFLQWQIIREAKTRGLKFYNFWGISKNVNPNHRFAGVTLFKTGFGGKRVDWLHAQDLPVSSQYWLTYIFETARRILRRL